MLTRTFTPDDQLAFAELSGDYNELHVDAVAARRSLFGSPVVHGVNALLWALDTCLQGRQSPCEIASLKVLFTRQIKVGEEVHLEVIRNDDSAIRLKILAADTPVATISIKLGEPDMSGQGAPEDGFPEKLIPIDLADDEFQSARGELDLFLHKGAVKRLYPGLADYLSPIQIAVMLGSTRIVGVHCPGKHSLFSELELASGADNDTRLLTYEVESVDERFGLIEMALNAPNMSGFVRAFRRPEPQKQADFRSLRERVSDDEFAAQRALIIGGSRGLGEVVAKLLTAGGADTRFTYHQGKKEADELVKEIVGAGGSAATFQYDVLNPQKSDKDMPREHWHPTHLYYFATPFIAPGVSGQFSMPLFRKFCDYYVAGLEQALTHFSADTTTHLFSPSSVMVDDTPQNLQEYVAAKITSEMFGSFLKRAHPGMVIYEPRLPRMATDQTANVAAVTSDDPVPVMLRELRAFQNLKP